MNKDKAKITDRNIIEEVFQKRFKASRVYIKVSDLNIQTSIFSYMNGLIFAKARKLMKHLWMLFFM